MHFDRSKPSNQYYWIQNSFETFTSPAVKKAWKIQVIVCGDESVSTANTQGTNGIEYIAANPDDETTVDKDLRPLF